MSSNGSPPPEPSRPGELARVLGVPGAVLLGLGSIVGTGIFVTIGTAAGVAGSSVLISIALAALVATCNGLASAQLAAAIPVSGGAYEYAYRLLGAWPGRAAGAMFVCAKTASAATAALGFAGYTVALVERKLGRWVRETLDFDIASGGHAVHIGLAIGAVVALTAIVVGGMKRSSRTNAIIVGITLVTLATFVIATLPGLRSVHFSLGSASMGDIVHATALVFVAYTGYGRIATLGEEVHEPQRTIPRAMVITLLATAALYIVVATSALGRVGAEGLAIATRETNAPLEAIAPGAIRTAIAVGAITAMLGVILNLLLGISRVVLAMARRRDLPHALSRVDGASPRRAVVATGLAIAALALIGSVKITWTVSAFTVLVYYSIMNLCALRQPVEQRRVPQIVPALGLVACLALAVGVLVH